jgi:prephenate dehydrogenase
VTRAAVVGLGLIGGSIALALKARGFDRSPAARDAARGAGIDAADTLSDAVADAEVVFAAVSTDDAPKLLIELASAAPGAILTDTASRKGPVVDAARKLRTGVRFVAGHPMAGSHRSGAGAATADLFRGRPWVLCRTARSDEASFEALSALVRAMGARPVPLDAASHDRLMTWASHLPLAVASALARAAARNAGPDLRRVAGPGFLDTTRVAGQPAALALELALGDPKSLAAAIEEVGAELGVLAKALRAGKPDDVRRYFEEASSARRDE